MIFLEKKYPKLYLAYGSNLSLEQMADRCKTAKPVATTVIENYALRFKGFYEHAVATIEPEEGQTVPVLIWKLEEADIVSLDKYEGYPYMYHKEIFTVTVNGKKIKVFAYIMNESFSYYGVPSEEYLAIICDGYKDNGFDTSKLKQSVNDNFDQIFKRRFTK